MYKVLVGKREGKGPLGRSDVDGKGRITLERTLNRLGERELDLSGS